MATSLKIVATLRTLTTEFPDLASLHTEADYFERNAARMRYPNSAPRIVRRSGVIEAGCKMIGARLKPSGTLWTVRGANAIIALRCHMRSNRFDDYWDARRA